MNIYDNDIYKSDVFYATEYDLPWSALKDKSIMITGATGLVGSFLIDVLIDRNERFGLNASIIAVARDQRKFEDRFSNYKGYDKLRFFRHDVSEPFDENTISDVDYILHLASNTHPRLYSQDPIGTITTNVLGTKHLLDFAATHNTKRFLLASSNEIYGENRGDVEFFDETYCGFIDCNTLRAGYPESKRCSEAMCQAYKRQKGIDVVIARLTRCYGATLLKSDSKALSQFIGKAIAGEDIVLKSSGNQFFSYIHVVDAVTGILSILLKGESGEAYNIADSESDIRLKDLAGLIAGYMNKKVIFEIPDSIESAGYSKATKARLSSDKIRGLGWQAKYSIDRGVTQTIDILRSIDSVMEI